MDHSLFQEVYPRDHLSCLHWLLAQTFAYVGTKFIATEEANASPGYKQMIIDSTADDIMYSATFHRRKRKLFKT
jgi:hypothetical protein